MHRTKIMAGAFNTGAAATQAEDRIIYNGANGNLFYDANGTDVVGLTQFAKLTAGLALSNTDFYVV
jgi:Ca2+-binding RTX toxin-like protein